MPEDKYVNQAYLTVTEGGANTLTFAKLEVPISIYEKVGWVIHRLDYTLIVSATNFGATDDAVTFGISVNNGLSAVLLSDPVVVDWNRIQRLDLGTAASGLVLRMPFSKSFADFPGGGLLVPPNPIYIFAQGAALGSAMQVQARLFYTTKILKTEEFWELVELRRMIGA